jgi:hypothetical protein
MRAAMGGGGGVPAKNLKVEAESLLGFKKRVDGILTDLESGATSNISSQVVARTSFGGEFSEAGDLYAQYNRVHSLLTTLSRTLGDQIEAMGIAVLGAKNGFQNMDDDVRRRFWEIQTRAQQREQNQRDDQRERREEEDRRLGNEPATESGHGRQGEGFE